MADILCGYTADRDEILIAYLYGEIETAQRAAFETHVATCERCRHELGELRGVQVRLQDWSAPAATGMVGVLPARGAPVSSMRRKPSVAGVLRELPAWAQVAAALLFLGASAGIANLDIRFDHDGLSVRTGWSRPLARTDSATGPTEPVSAATAARAWQPDLIALEERLQKELHANVAPAAQAGRAATDTELLRQVRALIQESERKQQTEVALRIGEVVRDVDTKRGTDLANIDRTLRTVQNDAGIEIARTQQRLNYLTRVSLQK